MNTGGPAFPLTASTGDPRDGVYCQNGMTLLDWMAGQALIGLMADPAVTAGHEVVAKVSYGIASAMLAEKARREADHSEDTLGKVAALEAANRELVEALEACESAFSKFAPQEESAYGTAWIKVRAVLSKAKGVV